MSQPTHTPHPSRHLSRHQTERPTRSNHRERKGHIISRAHESIDVCHILFGNPLFRKPNRQTLITPYRCRNYGEEKKKKQRENKTINAVINQWVIYIQQSRKSRRLRGQNVITSIGSQEWLPTAHASLSSGPQVKSKPAKRNASTHARCSESFTPALPPVCLHLQPPLCPG